VARVLAEPAQQDAYGCPTAGTGEAVTPGCSCALCWGLRPSEVAKALELLLWPGVHQRLQLCSSAVKPQTHLVNQIKPVVRVTHGQLGVSKSTISPSPQCGATKDSLLPTIKPPCGREWWESGVGRRGQRGIAGLLLHICISLLKVTAPFYAP